MKKLIAALIFASLSSAAFAHPGSNKLVCKSATNSGSKQKLELSLQRSNGKGWYAPIISLTVDKKKFEFTTPDDNNNYGDTFHNSPLKVILVTVDVPVNDNTNAGFLSVTAIPETVKAYNHDNKPVKWSLKAEKDDCNDSNGRATFQGIMRGFLRATDTEVDVEAQVMDCELSYNSGMAC